MFADCRSQIVHMKLWAHTSSTYELIVILSLLYGDLTFYLISPPPPPPPPPKKKKKKISH